MTSFSPVFWPLAKPKRSNMGAQWDPYDFGSPWELRLTEMRRSFPYTRDPGFQLPCLFTKKGSHSGFHEWGYLHLDVFLMENAFRMDDLGVHLFLETSTCQNKSSKIAIGHREFCPQSVLSRFVWGCFSRQGLCSGRCSMPRMPDFMVYISISNDTDMYRAYLQW